MGVQVRRAPVGVRGQRGGTDVGFWSGPCGRRNGGRVGGRGIRDGLGLSLDVRLTRLASNPVFTTELVRNFGAICLDLLLVPHPFGTFHAPTQAVDIETNAGFTRTVNANFVAFLSAESTCPASTFSSGVGTRNVEIWTRRGAPRAS